jgi:DNA-binding NarL/FixJ family response regulator
MTKIKVILADDHAVVRAGIRQFLERAADIDVVAEADDGEAARRMLEEFKPDVAVLDLQMPKASGIEITRWLRSTNLNVGTLILTAYDDDPYVMAALQAGANGYVLKTAAPDEIIQAVRDVHAGRSVLDPAIAKKLISQSIREATEIPVEPLTSREQEVLVLVGRGQTNKAIALELGISDRTVQGHLANIFVKLHAASRTEAVMRAVSLGLIEVEL